MATNALSIAYEADATCELVRIRMPDRKPVTIGFEDDQDLAASMWAADVPEDVADEVFVIVHRHRMADQFELEA